MSSIRNTLGILLLLGSFTAVIAQSPAGEDAAYGADEEVRVEPCVPESDTDTDTDADTREDAPAGNPLDAVPCEEPQTETAALDEPYPGETADEALADADAVEPETTGDDVTAEQEFESGEEISEDYPVPLPADI